MIRKTNDISNDWDGPLPIWVRAPKAGLEFFSGLSRSKIYQLAKEGEIETRTLRKPGQPKATRLFRLRSILDYIEAAQ
jgi:hypothetical protein